MTRREAFSSRAAAQRPGGAPGDHYLTIKNLNDVAEACHVDPAYLCRLFQRFGREQPGHYLLHLRLNRAADLIQNSELMIKEVSDKLGFSDPYNFSRAFRRAFGVPPGHLRTP